MINGETISQAERMLRIVVGDGMDVSGQMRAYEVDRQAYENFHQEMMSLFIHRLQQTKTQYPRTIIPVINTLMVHQFLIGVVCGRLTASGAQAPVDAGSIKAERDQKRKHPTVVPIEEGKKNT